MEIDPFEDVDLLIERSRGKDENIMENNSKNEEKERLQLKERNDSEKKKKKTVELKTEKVKLVMKKQKQQKKDEKKKERKKRNSKIISSSNGQKFRIPNIRNIPENCKHLFKENEVVYVVPGDGCCGPNCAAALLFHDEVFGPKLRKRMNLFFAKHWYKRYQYVSQCSDNHPFERKVKGGEIKKFTNPKELIKFLKYSPKADYMWADSEDLSIISDMYQINIKVVTTKGEVKNLKNLQSSEMLKWLS